MCEESSLISARIDPASSETDLSLLFRLSYEVSWEKIVSIYDGTVSNGEERVTRYSA